MVPEALQFSQILDLPKELMLLVLSKLAPGDITTAVPNLEVSPHNSHAFPLIVLFTLPCSSRSQQARRVAYMGAE